MATNARRSSTYNAMPSYEYNAIPIPECDYMDDDDDEPQYVSQTPAPLPGPAVELPSTRRQSEPADSYNTYPTHHHQQQQEHRRTSHQPPAAPRPSQVTNGGQRRSVPVGPVSVKPPDRRGENIESNTKKAAFTKCAADKDKEKVIYPSDIV